MQEVPTDPSSGVDRSHSSSERRRTVLVIDDEPGLLLITCRALETHGYEPLSAATMEQAHALLAESDRAIDVAIVDLTLAEPDPDGAIGQLRAGRPEMIVILSSGMRPSEPVKKADAFLAKPYSIEELALSVGAAVGDA